jgi:hypothetical protein
LWRVRWQQVKEVVPEVTVAVRELIVDGRSTGSRGALTVEATTARYSRVNAVASWRDNLEAAGNGFCAGKEIAPEPKGAVTARLDRVVEFPAGYIRRGIDPESYCGLFDTHGAARPAAHVAAKDDVAV